MNRSKLNELVHSKRFINFVNYAIVFNAFVVGMETLALTGTLQTLFRLLDFLFLAFFVVEIILRILAEQHPGQYFLLFLSKRVKLNGKDKLRYRFSEHGFWNYFDFILVALSVIGTFAQFVHPTFIEVGRLFRIFRIFRLLEISEHVKDVERRIVSIVPTVFSFVVLLMIMTYIYSVTGMYMFGRNTYDTCDFSNLVDSCVTLFQIMTLDNWSDVMKDLVAHSPNYPGFFVQLYFVSFVVFTSIIAFNVFIAVMTSQVQERIEKEAKEAVEHQSETADHRGAGHQLILEELKVLRRELAELKGARPQI